jgi:hypothetical protein
LFYICKAYRAGQGLFGISVKKYTPQIKNLI